MTVHRLHIRKQNERRIVSTLLFEIGDFDVQVKARNAFLTEDFSPRMWQKY